MTSGPRVVAAEKMAQAREKAAQEAGRYPCGKLRPPPPNPATIGRRLTLLGYSLDHGPLPPFGVLVDYFAGRIVLLDLEGCARHAGMRQTTSPLTLAGFHGLLTDRQVAAGNTYADLYRRAGVSLPTVQVANPLKVRGYDNSLGDREAHATLRTIWDALRPDPLALIALSNICLLDLTPSWLERKEPDRQHAALVRGLAAVLPFVAPEKEKPAKGLRPFKAMTTAYTAPGHERRAVPAKRLPGRRETDQTRYLTPEGELLLEVLVRRRIAA